MPNLFRIGKYLIFFWSNENNEPVHVHISEGSPSPNSTKIWITSSGGCIVANNNSRIPNHDLNKLLEAISAHFFVICSEWKQHFDSNVKFYC